MRPHFCHCLVAGLFLVLLILATPQPVSATIVFDDHFDGNSGGMPEGWHLLFGSGTVVESGTTVTFCDDVGIGSSVLIEPFEGTVVITTEIAQNDTEFGVGAFVASPDISSYFGSSLYVTNGEIEVVAGDIEGGEQRYVAGYLNEYAGGAIQLTITMEALTFSISTDFPPFSTGPIQYSDAFPAFTREDLGSSVFPALANGAGVGGLDDCSSIDRITVDVEGATPVGSMTFGRIKALFRR